MTLVRREDSDNDEAAATVDRIAWLAGMAAQMDIPVVASRRTGRPTRSG